ncbi:hypothetical protein DSO57_1017074 [Entomophthora muscae]|uniref:Uncharacterized protein n=1 Tax=Entomophthora muscae TaxID=34485 RepID=A0ACC2STS7_9FUNG|nr:hypothetical protein DSO57_1017074 [Entomophthora muscae]
MIKLFEGLSNMAVVDDIVAKVSTIPNFMDLPLYSAAMAAYARNSNVDAVLQLFSRLKKQGLKPDLFIFSSVICGLGNVGRIDEMLQQLAAIAEYNLEPDVTILNSIMRTQLSDTDAVIARFTELAADPMLQPDSYTFNCLILLHLQRGDLASAQAVRDQMLKSGVTPTWVTFAQFIGHFSETHDPSKAFLMLDEMKRAGVHVNTAILNLMVELCIKVGDFAKACELIDDFPHVPLDIVTHTLLMRHHAKNKDHERVLQHFKVIKRLNLPMSAIAYDVIFYSMVQTKDSAMLLSTFHEMVKRHGIQPDTTIINTIMRGLALGSNPYDAADFFKHVLENHSESAPPNLATYNLLLSAYLRIGKRDLATQLVEHMVFLGQNGFPELLPDNQTWSQLLWAYAKSKDIKALEDGFKRFSEPPFSLRPTPQVFEALILGYFSTRDLTKAKRIFQLSTRQKSQTTPKMLSLYVSILGAEGSLTALQREWVTLPDRFSPDVAAHRWVYIAYLQALVKCGGYQEAVDVFSRNIHSPNRRLHNNKAAVSVLAKALRARRRTFELKELESHVASNYPTLLHALTLK